MAAILILILFFLSGFAALAYEVVWFRELGLVFGNTVHAAAAVGAAYMLGLAAGARAGARFADRLRHPLRAFAVLEVIIALYALGMPLLLHVVRLWYRAAYPSLGAESGVLTAIRFVGAIAMLIVPTFCMGATLPVLTRHYAAAPETFGRRLGYLYGLNTLGAVAGVLASGFLLLPRLGMTGAARVAIATSLAVAAGAALLSCKVGVGRDTRDAGREEAASHASRQPAWGLMALAVVLGFLALGLEVAWFRSLILVFGSTTYSFVVMLSIFLAGIGIGAAVFGRCCGSTRSAGRILATALAGAGLYTLGSLFVFDRMPELLLRLLLSWGMSWEAMIAAKCLLAALFLMPPALLSGAAFPAVAALGRARIGSSAAAAGRVSMWNCLGAAAGSTLVGFWLLPAVGMAVTLTILAVTYLAVCCLVLRVLKLRGRTAALGALAVVLAVLAVRPPVWNATVLTSGAYFAPWNFIEDDRVVLDERLRTERLVFYEEGRTTSVSVLRTMDERLYFCSNGKVEADTTPRSMALQRMIGHLPMLLHASPRRVLNIGLGAGVTLGALACYPLDRLEVVEIEPAVAHVARIWRDLNHNVMARTNLVVTINDGRNHLFATRETYDVITSDPFEPIMAGASALYTVDHFQLARARLAPGGIMAQFLPLYELSQEDYRMIVRSFMTVFPRSLLFFTGYDTILLGCTDDAWGDFARVREKFDIPAVRASLAEVGVAYPEGILDLWVADLGRQPGLAGAGPLHSDARPHIEFSVPKSAFRYRPDINQQVLSDHFTPLPDALTAGLAPAAAARVVAGRDALRRTLAANSHRVTGDLRRNIDLLVEAIELAPDSLVVRNELAASLQASAQVMVEQGNPEQAYAQFQLALRFDPRDFWSLYHLVNLAMQARRQEAAARFLAQGLAAYPDSPLLIGLRGKMRGSQGDLRGACADLAAAVAVLPGRAGLWRDYARFLALAGETDAAARATRAAEAL